MSACILLLWFTQLQNLTHSPTSTFFTTFLCSQNGIFFFVFKSLPNDNLSLSPLITKAFTEYK